MWTIYEPRGKNYLYVSVLTKTMQQGVKNLKLISETVYLIDTIIQVMSVSLMPQIVNFECLVETNSYDYLINKGVEILKW